MAQPLSSAHCQDDDQQRFSGEPSPGLHDIAALLEEKDPMSEMRDSDMTLRLSIPRSTLQEESGTLEPYRSDCPGIQEDAAYQRKTTSQLMLRKWAISSSLAYPERIAHATDHAGNFKMSNGNTIFIDPSDSMAANEWLAIASLNLSSTSSSKLQGRKGRVFLSAPSTGRTCRHKPA